MNFKLIVMNKSGKCGMNIDNFKMCKYLILGNMLLDIF